MHDAVIINTGMPEPRLLDVPGSKVKNVFHSAEFVGWYNGDPEHKAVQVSLEKIKRVAVVGHGNVALDVARVLLKPWAEFEHTSVSAQVLDVLRSSQVNSVDLIGRRGPLQVRAPRYIRLIRM